MRAESGGIGTTSSAGTQLSDRIRTQFPDRSITSACMPSGAVPIAAPPGPSAMPAPLRTRTRSPEADVVDVGIADVGDVGVWAGAGAGAGAGPGAGGGAVSR